MEILNINYLEEEKKSVNNVTSDNVAELTGPHGPLTSALNEYPSRLPYFSIETFSAYLWKLLIILCS